MTSRGLLTKSSWTAALLLAGTLLFGGCNPILPGQTPTYKPSNPAPKLPQPTAQSYALLAQEQTLTFEPQPDGSVQVSHSYIFDAGDGQKLPLTGYLRSIRVLNSKDYHDSWYADPQLASITAQDRTDPDHPIDLRVDRYDSNWDADGKVIYLSAPDGFGAGRHLVQVSYRWTGVWVDAEGTRMLVLPHLTWGVPWYGVNQTDGVVRLQTSQHDELWCGTDNPNYGAAKPCADQTDGQVAVVGRFDSLGTVSSNNVFYYLPAPVQVTADPSAARKVTR